MAAALPRVTFVIPCFNHGEFLPEAVASAKAQTYPATKIIIVDDGSTDDCTRQELSRQAGGGVRVIHQQNQGLAAARNTGVQAAGESPFFVPLDADDRVEPGFVRTLLTALHAAPEASHAYCWTRFFGAARRVWRCESWSLDRLILQNLHPATALVRRSAFDAAGGYRPAMEHGYEDWDFWLALAAGGAHGVCVRQPLFCYRQHASGASMLARMGSRRREMRQRMVERHHALFECWLRSWPGPMQWPQRAVDGREISSDSSAESVRAASGCVGATRAERVCAERADDKCAADGTAAAARVDEILAELEAAIAIDHIERSRAWRTLQGLGAAGGSAAECDGGPRCATRPSERLRQIHADWRYRAIQAIKRIPPYPWLTRWLHGANSGPPRL